MSGKNWEDPPAAGAPDAAAPASAPTPPAPSSPPRTIIGKRRSSESESVVQFERGNLLGKGAFAQCYEVQNETDKFAAKIIAKSRITTLISKQKLVAEIKVHRMLKHDNIVKFISYFEDDHFHYLLLELCNHKTLRSLLRRRTTLTEIEVRYYMSQILDGVEFLHGKGILHRDLKLDNIFLKDMTVKIGDLGLSTKLSPGELKHTLCGTPNYIAPEVLLRKGHSFPADVWSVGVVMYTLLFGHPPFESPDRDVEDTYERIKRMQYHFPTTTRVSHDARCLIIDILTFDPALRPTINTIRQHAFFNGYMPRTLPPHCLVEAPVWKAKYENWTGGRPSVLPPPPGTLKRRPFTTALQSPTAPSAGATANSPLPAPGTDENGLPNRPQKKRRLNSDVSSPEVVIHATISMEAPRSFVLRILKNALAIGAGALSQGRDEHVRSTMPTPGPSHWISRWIDYSQRFGLGYQLCNGTVGVIFNDNSKICRDPVSRRMFFAYPPDRTGRVETAWFGPDQEGTTHFLSKRFTLLHYFETSLRKCHPSQGLEDERMFEDGANIVHVLDWRRSDNAIFFSLSNGGLQVNFYDHAKIVVTPGQPSPYAVDKVMRPAHLDVAMTRRMSAQLPVQPTDESQTLMEHLQYLNNLAHEWWSS